MVKLLTVLLQQMYRVCQKNCPTLKRCNFIIFFCKNEIKYYKKAYSLYNQGLLILFHRSVIVMNCLTNINEASHVESAVISVVFLCNRNHRVLLETAQHVTRFIAVADVSSEHKRKVFHCMCSLYT